jgi:hypothetical protein
VIGILDALKHESNVAGWIRGGRVRPASAPSPVPIPVPANGADVENSTDMVPSAVDENGHGTKRRRLSDEASRTPPSSSLLPASSPPPASPSSPPPLPTSSPPSSPSIPGLSLSQGLGLRAAQLHPFPPLPAPTPDNADDSSPVREQWYEDPGMVAYWVERGGKGAGRVGD